MATNWPTSRDTFTNPSSGDTLDSPSHAAQHANVNDAVEAMQLHAGLVLVKTQTIGTAVSSVTVSDAFSSTFQNYRVVIYIDSASANDGLRIQFGSTTTGYYGSLYYDLYTGGSTGTARTNNGTNLDIGLTEVNNRTFTGFDVGVPNQTEQTFIHGTYFGRGYAGWFGGTLANTTAYTAFTILPAAGTLTGGTIRVYGYNNG